MTSSLPAQSQDSQTLNFSDGRTLGYAIFGSTPSPDIPTIFYFHGFPTSRLEGVLLKSKKYALTIIAIDRPGMGLSSFQPGRRILDWPSDVLAIADHLKIARFYALGDSGGSPYALVCAKEIPRTRLLGTAVVSGVYPLALGTQGTMFSARMLFFAAAWLPSFVLAKFLDLEFGNMAPNIDPKISEESFMKVMEKRSERDRRCCEDEDLRKLLVETVRESFRQGSEGPAWDLGLYTDWGFELQEVDGENVVLWHGKEDINTPFGMAEKAVKLLKGCELRAFEEETHLSLPLNHMEEIVEALLSSKFPVYC
jgi:pimeloyl-ACP methyl ester carboxylesterase